MSDTDVVEALSLTFSLDLEERQVGLDLCLHVAQADQFVEFFFDSIERPHTGGLADCLGQQGSQAIFDPVALCDLTGARCRFGSGLSQTVTRSHSAPTLPAQTQCRGRGPQHVIPIHVLWGDGAAQ